MKRNKSFTIVEILLVSIMAGLIFVIVITLYFKMIRTRVDVEARQALIQNSTAMIERLNVMMKDYTIDYEEYFNRRVVGCDNDSGMGFTRDVDAGTANGHCDNFTTYGNTNQGNTDWGLYYCSSNLSSDESSPNNIYVAADMKTDKEGCWIDGQTQAYGEYAMQFRDMGTDTDDRNGAKNDDDDLNLGIGPVAVGAGTGVQELYLISKDKQTRLLIRRTLFAQGDWDNSGTTGDSFVDKWYNLEMLQLKGFDAGVKHDFNAVGNEGMYDGQIDTRACDYAAGFVCSGNPVNYATGMDYRLPSDKDDGRVKIFDNNITLSSWNMKIYPTKEPEYAFRNDDVQINPYINIYLQTKLYGEPWAWKLDANVLDGYVLDLQTTFNIKSNY